MNLNAKQIETLVKIRIVAKALGIDPDWAAAVAMTESALGLHQLSKTGAKGVFQMTTIAMKDLLQEMEKKDDDMIDIACGVLFLRLLFRRHKSIDAATAKYCDPKDRGFYLERVAEYKKQLANI